MRYRADIDGIRAIAVLLVVVFHFGLIGFGQAGFIGVDVFFVISGYLISNIIWRDLGAGTFSLGHFYARRIRRLAPALIAVQVAVLAIGAIFLMSLELSGLAKETLAAQAYVSNFYYWKTLDYFGLHSEGAFLLHTWSLGVEEQFYLFYPLFLMAIHRFARRWFVPILAATTIASFAINIAFVHSTPTKVFYLLPYRAWELGVGALLPAIEPWFVRQRRARVAAAPLGLALIVAALAIHGPNTVFPGWFALLPVAASACLLLAGAGDSNPVSRLLSIPQITFFGRISYPLYLVHWPIHVFGSLLIPDYSPGARWVMFAASVVSALAITLWVERPIRTGAVLPKDRQVVGAYLVALSAVMIAAGALVYSKGWSSRFSAQVQEIAAVGALVDMKARREFQMLEGDDIRRRARHIGAEGVAPTWLVYGDSHARALAPAIGKWLAARGEAGEVIYRPSCLPLLDVGVPVCRALNRQAVAYAGGRRVLLVSLWSEPLELAYRGRTGKILRGRQATDDASAAIARTISALRAAGAGIYIWEPLPQAPRGVPMTMARNTAFGHFWPNTRSLTAHREQFHFVTAALDRAGIARSNRVDPALALCDGGTCDFEVNGLPLYSDTNHPASHATDWFADLIGDQLGVESELK